MKAVQVEFGTRAEAQAALPHLRAMLRAATEVVEAVDCDYGFVVSCGPDMEGWMAQAYVVTKRDGAAAPGET